VTAVVAIVLLIATFSYNRGSMLGRFMGLAAAFCRARVAIPSRA